MSGVRGRRPALLALALAAAAGCGERPVPDTAPGVSIELARLRARTLSNLRYEIELVVPARIDEPIQGRETVRFDLSDEGSPLVFDFKAAADAVIAVRVGGEAVQHQLVNDHLVIPAAALQAGENAVEIEFRAGDGSLNRNPDFLYTLFVPDRARFAFPCFDQPDLKAQYRLTLDLPATWQAVANGELRSHAVEGERARFRFAPTRPISTYLFAFAAGAFRVEETVRDGRTLRFYHRETDTARVARNREEIFDLHEAALDWLEDYTGIDYPFGKFEFVLVPSFQYNGMEHPGAILYRASRLLLDESPTQEEQLRRASLIAHETAHMWFGDLVTMRWFDDVWTKEVFANFMAAKIVHPSFPEIDHDLRFLLAHYPAAYEVDRTPGANPIRQQLDNLAEAGTLYGAIIYQKAPIVMRQLERLLGEEKLREGLREYLRRHSFANATWPELIEILDARAEEDLSVWSAVWVEEPGRPTVWADWSTDGAGRLSTLELRQSDPAGAGRTWSQRLSVRLAYPDGAELLPISLDQAAVPVEWARGSPTPEYVLANGGGEGYGLFLLDSISREFLLRQTPELDRGLTRAIAWLTLWDAMLEEVVPPARMIDLAVATLRREQDELIVQRVLSYLEQAYWRYSSAADRSDRSGQLEALLWQKTREAPTASLKSAYFDTYVSLAVSDEAVRRLEAVWRGEIAIEGLALSEADHTRLARELAVREIDGWDAVLAAQEDRIENPDRRAEFRFVRPALSAAPSVRDSFFASLSVPENREHEPWVLEAVGYLHHPLRARSAEAYIRPSLELLEEIQATGDIFFPKRWLDATLGGHNTTEAAAVVRRFLAEHPDYPPRLRGKILQAADPLFRATRILDGAG